MNTGSIHDIFKAESKRDKRRFKRYMNHLASKLKYGAYFSDCNYHPCRVSSRTIYPSDIHGWDVQGISLVTGTYGTSCSLTHCAPSPMTKEMAEKQAAYLKTQGNSYGDAAFAVMFQESEPPHLTRLWRRYVGNT